MTKHRKSSMCLISLTLPSEISRCASALVQTRLSWSLLSVISLRSHGEFVARNMKKFLLMVKMYVFQQQGGLSILGYDCGLAITKLKCCLCTQVWMNHMCILCDVNMFLLLTFQMSILVQTAQKFAQSRLDLKHVNYSAWWWFQHSHRQGRKIHTSSSLNRLSCFCIFPWWYRVWIVEEYVPGLIPGRKLHFHSTDYQIQLPETYHHHHIMKMNFPICLQFGISWCLACVFFSSWCF